MIMNNIKTFFQNGVDLRTGEDRFPGEIGQERLQSPGPALHPMNRNPGVVRVLPFPLIGELVGMRVTRSYNVHAMAVPGQVIGKMIYMQSAATGMEWRIKGGYQAETFLL